MVWFGWDCTESMRMAAEQLEILGAVERKDDKVTLTPLGKKMANFPLEPRFSKVRVKESVFVFFSSSRLYFAQNIPVLICHMDNDASIHPYIIINHTTHYCLLIHAPWLYGWTHIFLAHRPSSCPQSSPAQRRFWQSCPCSLWTRCSTTHPHAGRTCSPCAGSSSRARATTWRCWISIELLRKLVEIRWVGLTWVWGLHCAHRQSTSTICALSPR